MKYENQQNDQPVIQREMPFFAPIGGRQLKDAKWVPENIVSSWSSYREAVLWCWDNRPHTGKRKKNGDEMLFVSETGSHPPHMSRWVDEDSKSPMKLDPDLIDKFEAFTGWRGIIQYLTRKGSVTPMEQVIDQRRAA